MFERLFGEKFSRFRLGQIIFAVAVSFGLFAGDIIRIVLGVLALFCLTKENFKFNWTRGQKITGCILALFCAWMIVIPVIFGENPLPVRLRDAVRPVELTLWICATLLFAKDEFFVRNLKNFSITACFLYSLIALHWCFETHFALDYKNWPVLKAAYSVEALMAGISAWLIYQFVATKNNFNRLFCSILMLLSLLFTILPRYTTFWAAISVSICTALLLLLCTDIHRFAKLLLLLCFAVCIAGCALYAGMERLPSIKSAITQEIEQLRIENPQQIDLQRFTSKRWEIWKAYVTDISVKPVFGYGREVFPDFCAETHHHAHNSFLQAAFEGGIPLALLFTAVLAMIFILAFLKIRQTGAAQALPFVTSVVMSQFVTAGLVENLYLTNRSILVFYWSIFISMLALYNAADMKQAD